MSFELRLLLSAFALYRLARLLALEEGPAGIFEGIRARLGAYHYGEDGLPSSNLGRLAVCPLCWGLWLSPLAVLAVYTPTLLGDIILIWLALAGAAVWLQRTEHE
jgi:hypothetical protein